MVDDLNKVYLIDWEYGGEGEFEIEELECLVADVLAPLMKKRKNLMRRVFVIYPLEVAEDEYVLKDGLGFWEIKEIVLELL